MAAAPSPSPGWATGPGKGSESPDPPPAPQPQLPDLPPGCPEGHRGHSVSRCDPGPISLPGLLHSGLLAFSCIKDVGDLVVVQQRVRNGWGHDHYYAVITVQYHTQCRCLIPARLIEEQCRYIRADGGEWGILGSPKSFLVPVLRS